MYLFKFLRRFNLYQKHMFIYYFPSLSENSKEWLLATQWQMTRICLVNFRTFLLHCVSGFYFLNRIDLFRGNNWRKRLFRGKNCIIGLFGGNNCRIAVFRDNNCRRSVFRDNNCRIKMLWGNNCRIAVFRDNNCRIKMFRGQ